MKVGGLGFLKAVGGKLVGGKRGIEETCSTHARRG